jgi:hypothetical protein
MSAVGHYANALLLGRNSPMGLYLFFLRSFCKVAVRSANKERQNPIYFFLRSFFKVAVRSANKERQNPIKGKKKKKCAGCAIFVRFLLLLCVVHVPGVDKL